MSTLKVDTIDTPDSSGNITVSRPLSGSGASLTNLNGSNIASGTVVAARLPALGKVLQVVEGTTTTQTSTTSTSYVASDLSVTITPSATSSKILVTASAPINANDTTSADIGGAWTIYRDSTDLISNGGDTFYSSLAQNYAGLMMPQKLDSPNSTYALVYKVYLKSTQSGTTMKNCHNNSMGVITAVEIGA